jgi:polyhydroxybutyrate depolymerase
MFSAVAVQCTATARNPDPAEAESVGGVSTGPLPPQFGAGPVPDPSTSPPASGASGTGTAPSPSETPPTPSFEAPSASGAAPPPASEVPGTSEVPAATCTGASTLSAGNQTLSIVHDGEERTYIVHVPDDLDSGVPVPLVVDMHGLTSSATQQSAISGWRQKADAEGFIVVHPQGLDASWNGGDLCCGTSQSQGVDDEGFIRAMVAQLVQDACIDEKRIYATGLSNGGAMSHLLACDAADLFAASAPVSMGNGTRPCEPSRPISVVMTRGTQDRLVAFNGGLFPSAQADFEQWAALNGCQGEPQPADELCQVFNDCDGGVEVKLCALAAGHVLYSNSQDFSVPDVVWQTFERQRLP